jgi:hypothetical protein
MVPLRRTSERALPETKRPAVEAAVRCPGRFAAVPGGVLLECPDKGRLPAADGCYDA